MKKERGLTLIALVVTIVILLILAAVSIAMLSGENGIIAKAKDARKLTEIGEEKERITLAYSTIKGNKLSSGNNDAVTATELETEINKEEGKDTVKVVGEEELTVTYQISQRSYKINSSGKIEEDLLTKLNNNKDEYIQQAIANGQSSTNKNIGLDENLNVVNMDYWSARETTEKVSAYGGSGQYGYYAYGINQIEYIGIALSEEKGSDQGCGYVGPINNETGKIYGEIPAYVSIDSGEFLPVISLEATFFEISELKIAPKIPSTVISMNYTFQGCTSLTTVEEIPYNVINMFFTFRDCSSLTGKMKINAKLNEAFYTGVYNYGYFYDITKSYTFAGAATNEDANLVLTGESAYINAIISTKSENSNISKE